MTTQPQLSTSERKVLAVLASGGYVAARRTFPHPHNFWLYRADGHKYADRVPAATISHLLELGVLRVAGEKDPQFFDKFGYRLDKKALRRVLSGGGSAGSAQLDWTRDCP